MKLSGKVQFKITMTSQQMLTMGCFHVKEAMKPETCRACSVSVHAMKELTDLTFYDDMEQSIRVIHGTVESVEQRLVLSRMIAFAYGHPEPLGMCVWQNEDGEWVTKREIADFSQVI